MTSKQIQKIIDEYEDAEEIYKHVRNKLEKVHEKERQQSPLNETLNYWDGKRIGLKFALNIIEEI